MKLSTKLNQTKWTFNDMYNILVTFLEQTRKVVKNEQIYFSTIKFDREITVKTILNTM